MKHNYVSSDLVSVCPTTTSDDPMTKRRLYTTVYGVSVDQAGRPVSYVVNVP